MGRRLAIFLTPGGVDVFDHDEIQRSPEPELLGHWGVLSDCIEQMWDAGCREMRVMDGVFERGTLYAVEFDAAGEWTLVKIIRFRETPGFIPAFSLN